MWHLVLMLKKALLFIVPVACVLAVLFVFVLEPAAKFGQSGCKSGLLNKSGQVVVPAEYAVVPKFHDGYSRALIWGPGECQWYNAQVILRKEGSAIKKLQPNGKFVEAGALLVMDNGPKCVVIQPNGRRLAGPFDKCLGRFTDNTLIFRDKGEYFLFAQGQPPKNVPGCSEIRSHSVMFGRELVAAKKQNRWGFINSNGDFKIPPAFLDVQDTWDKFMFVQLVGAAKPNIWHLIDSDGVQRSKSSFSEIGIPRGGYAAVAETIAGKKKWGVVNADGEWILPPEYSGADVCSAWDGCISIEIPVGKVTKRGLRDSKGNWVLMPQFDDIWFVRNGKAIACIGGRSFDQTEKNVRLFDLKSKVFGDSYARIDNFGSRLLTFQRRGKDKRYGLMTMDGAIVKEPTFASFTSSYPTPENYIPASVLDAAGNECWGWIDRNGDWLIRPSYFGARPFSEGLAGCAVKTNGTVRCGWIDQSGNWVIKPKYVSAGDFSDGLASFGVDPSYLDVLFH